MLNNYTQRLEMQIPQENTYTGMTIMPKQEDKLTEFLKANFSFPSNNLDEIKEFISQDHEMERIVYGLPEIIAKEFQKNQLSIDFSDENKRELEVIILTNLNGRVSSDKQDLIEDALYTSFSWNAANKIFICVEFEC